MGWFTRLLMFFLPGGGLLQAIVKLTGGPDPDISKGVNIFDHTPYKEQVWKRRNPGKHYDASNVDKNGDTIDESLVVDILYGPGSKNYEGDRDE